MYFFSVSIELWINSSFPREFGPKCGPLRAASWFTLMTWQVNSWPTPSCWPRSNLLVDYVSKLDGEIVLLGCLNRLEDVEGCRVLICTLIVDCSLIFALLDARNWHWLQFFSPNWRSADPSGCRSFDCLLIWVFLHLKQRLHLDLVKNDSLGYFPVFLYALNFGRVVQVWRSILEKVFQFVKFYSELNEVIKVLILC